MTGFVHLSVHSEFSLVDGIAKIPRLVQRAVDLDMPAIALTDRANLFGMVKFYQACCAQGVKPIVGMDLTYTNQVASEINGNETFRCMVLAVSEAGYRNLLKLVSKAYTDSELRGTVRREWLFDAADGLLALSGGREGDIGRALVVSDQARAESLAHDWTRAFGDRFYLEVQRIGLRDEHTDLANVVDLADALGLPLVATNDVRFLVPDDFEAHETRVCIQEGRTLNDPRRERRYSDQQYLRSVQEMESLFCDLPEALENTVEIAKRCSLSVDLGTYHLPNYPVRDDTTVEEYFAECSAAGLEQRLDKLRRSTIDLDEQSYRDRLAFELNVINQMGFAGYFLIVTEFVNWAKDHDVPVGPGRGSGAGSLVAYSLGITGVDPLRYGLLFERLLNPERVSMPDFDIDFCMVGRDKVIAHVAEQYGHDAVSQIVTFGTMAAKAVVRDVARVQGKPYGLADRLSKMIPFEVGMTLTTAVAQEPLLREFIEQNEDVAEIMDMAYKLEGTVRNVGRHAGGVVIAPSALTDFVPLFAEESGGSGVSQFDKDDVEAVGLVKFDFLGLKTLTVIDWAIKAVNAKRQRTGEVPIDVDTLPLDDDATYEMLRTGETTALFQLESQGMKELIRKLAPDNIEDVIALVALFRPGPLQSGAVDDYIDRKHGRAPVAFAHPKLESVLESTYGVMLYQEHVMSAAQVLAGFSMGQADLLRRAMGKKKPEEMAQMREMFTGHAEAEGVDVRLANTIFDDMEKFAGYAFNKSHSAAYAMVTFQTAWLKTHHPAEFMAAVLSVDMQNIDKVVTLVDEVRRMGLELRSPDVNTGQFRFSAVGSEILYGLGAVRGVGEAPVEAIVEDREHNGAFASLHDFCLRVDARKANRRVIEALIRAGAMDCFAFDDESVDAVRARLMAELKTALHGAEQSARDAALGMDDMFGGVAVEQTRIKVAAVAPLDKRERLEGEKEALGLYLTGHPIDDYLEEIRQFCPTRISTLKVGRGRVAAGLVVSNRSRRSRRGHPMAFTVLDDRSGRIEASVFGDVLEANRDKLFKDAVLVLEGEVQPDDYSGAPGASGSSGASGALAPTGRLKLRVESILTIDEARARYAKCVEISMCADSIDAEFARMLKTILEPHRSDACRVAVSYTGEDAQGRVTLGEQWRVAPTDALLQSLRDAFGREAVAVRYG